MERQNGGAEMDKQSYEALLNAGAFGDDVPGKKVIFGDFGDIEPEWEKPIPFDEVQVPDFPLDALPEPVEKFVEALSTFTQTPPEMAGLLSLGVLSTAFQKRYTVEVRPGWTEPLCLYTVAVAAPAERKSAVLSALTRPVSDFERERRKDEAVSVAQNQTEWRLLEKALDVAERKNDRDQALALSAEKAEFKKFHPFRVLADDTTPEKLIEMMEAQGGAITVTSTEGGIFDILQGRYDNKGGLDIYLKAQSGDSITVDRLGREGNYVQDPRLTLMLTIQPEVLRGLMSNTTFKGRGLCGRFLYAMCRSKVGRREINPEDIPPDVQEGYWTFTQRILKDKAEGVIWFSPEAAKLRSEYAGHVERSLSNELEDMQDWGGKLVGAVCRIAALLTAAQEKNEISPETFSGAMKIGHCLTAHAMRAYQIMGADGTLANAKYLWRRIYNSGNTELSKHDLLQLTRGKFKRAEDMEPAIQELIDRNFIRRTVKKQPGGRGRPSEIIEVNPSSLNTL